MAAERDFPEFPLERAFDQYLAGLEGTEIAQTGYSTELYLDIAERIVRMASAWQDDAGRIIDPNTGAVHKQTTPRYASSLAPLIRAGRCEDLLEACARCLDVACRDLAEGNGEAFDFWTRDLAFAVHCLEGKVGSERVAAWRKNLSGFDPQERYSYVTSKRSPEELHNWAVYNLTGEWIKTALGMGDSTAFVEEQLATQRQRFTPLGMYRDPNCPTTYDLAVRQNLVLLMHYGYNGAHRDFVREMIRRGALTQLFFQSTTGEVPFGGRSNQFHHLEGMFCCCAEFEARRYGGQGSVYLAGVFKRAAHRAAGATLRWLLDADSPRHIKNMFGQETLHGCDSYGQVSVYSLLASYQFALAATFGEDTVAECAAPCDVGGYVMPVLDDFHRVFASCGPYHVQVDTCGQRGFDPTGLGRVHHRDCPSELGLSMGIVSDPSYRTAETPHPEYVAIGPCWKDAGAYRPLAEQQPDGAQVEMLKQDRSEVVFRVTYRAERTVVERYRLTPEFVEVSTSAGLGPVRITVPLLLTDGEVLSTLSREDRALVVAYRGAEFRAEVVDEDVRTGVLNVRAPNRNGVYDVGTFDRAGDEITVRFSFR